MNFPISDVTAARDDSNVKVTAESDGFGKTQRCNGMVFFPQTILVPSF